MSDNLIRKIAESADCNPRTIYKTLRAWKRAGLFDILEKEDIARLNKSKAKSQSLVSCQAKTKQTKSKKQILTQNSI